MDAAHKQAVVFLNDIDGSFNTFPTVSFVVIIILNCYVFFVIDHCAGRGLQSSKMTFLVVPNEIVQLTVDFLNMGRDQRPRPDQSGSASLGQSFAALVQCEP